MNILALHGVGSSAAMLKEQLAALAAELGPHYHFTFYDGQVPVERGPGMPVWSPGPFYSYVTGYAPDEVSSALDDLDHFIEQNGPFDGVLGFSQGASIAATYILDYQLRRPEEQPPFNFAVLFSSVGVCSPDKSCNEEIVQSFLTNADPQFKKGFPQCDFKTLDPTERTFAEYLAMCHIAIKTIGIKRPAITLEFFEGNDSDSVPRLLHPALIKDRISIPTVHVTGKKDLESMVKQSLVVQGLCDEDVARSHRHTGGHAVPSKKSEVKAVASSIEWAAEKGNHMSAVNQAGRVML
ncbi:hypothetical protein LA080_011016 [Diaporthe eres]|uniref:Serine hydrolase domain-containing protein n=1 Tax=Diaporthe vaccinii TaxID=105482 RepID=A0ABR4EDR7_9PEZI|nr:hypothetical protein LA080_011016 [Diaporthe eres]